MIDAPARRETDLARITYSTHARSTGAAVVAGKLQGEGWGVQCLSHGSVAIHQTRLLAEAFASRPHEWCGRCLLIAEGKAPKLPRPRGEELL